MKPWAIVACTATTKHRPARIHVADRWMIGDMPIPQRQIVSMHSQWHDDEKTSQDQGSQTTRRKVREEHGGRPVVYFARVLHSLCRLSASDIAISRDSHHRRLSVLPEHRKEIFVEHTGDMPVMPYG